MATTISFEASTKRSNADFYDDLSTPERRVFKFIQIFMMLCMVILLLGCFELALIGVVMLLGEGLGSFIVMIAMLTLYLMNVNWLVSKAHMIATCAATGMVKAYRAVKGWFTPSAA